MYNLILFGAGRYVKSYIQLIRFLGDTVSFIVDNDIEKQGKKIEGVEIISPGKLVDLDEPIMVSCMAFDEIRILLKELGVESREIRLEDYLEQKSDKVNKKDKIKNNNIDSVVFDLYSGSKWGGAENWNLLLANQISESQSQYKVSIISDEYAAIDEDLDFPIESFPNHGEMKLIIDYLSRDNGSIFVNSFFGKSFFAAIALKLRNPLKVKVVTIVHNDYKDLYKLCSMFEEYIDTYICVSTKIKQTLISQYNILEKKIFYLSQPILFDKTYSINDKKDYDYINIGIAGRLVSPQKRCDLIPKIIERLENADLNYKLYIAGDGDLFYSISDYIKERNLEDRITMYGKIPNDKMGDFWKKIDIYLNFSEFEGTSLSMLEAMSYGCVPVASDVSGVKDFIEHGINGYIYNFGDLDMLCQNIFLLEKDRKLMRNMGGLSREIIMAKCEIKKYADDFLKIVGK